MNMEQDGDRESARSGGAKVRKEIAMIDDWWEVGSGGNWEAGDGWWEGGRGCS